MSEYGTIVTHPGQEFQREHWAPLATPFSNATTITGTTLLTVWDPAAGKKFVLKGFSLTAVVRTDFAASNPVVLQWFDDSTAAFIADAGMAFESATPAGRYFSTGYVWLREGVPSAAADRVLKLGFSETISTGVLSVAGVVLGEER